MADQSADQAPPEGRPSRDDPQQVTPRWSERLGAPVGGTPEGHGSRTPLTGLGALGVGHADALRRTPGRSSTVRITTEERLTRAEKHHSDVTKKVEALSQSIQAILARQDRLDARLVALESSPGPSVLPPPPPPAPFLGPPFRACIPPGGH